MPISSSNRRLTRELYKPPPKSLDELMRSHQKRQSGSAPHLLRNDHGGSVNVGSGLSRERHLEGKRKTAVVGPINDSGLFTGGYPDGRDRNEVTSSQKSAIPPCDSNNTLLKRRKRCGYYGTRCNILAFVSGFLLGALLLGLIIGLILHVEIKERDAIIAELEEAQTGCFKDPCPTQSSSCGFSSNNTEIICLCENTSETDEATTISDAGLIDGYRCTFFNQTEGNVTTIPNTVVL